jgi:SAM-dependent methyltransferase
MGDRPPATVPGVTARFLRHDALRVGELGDLFDTALDSLVLHAFSATDRAVYLDGLRRVLRPGGRLYVLCYSDRHTTAPIPPHRLSRGDLEACFTGGWTLDSLEATVAASNLHADGVAARLAACTRI